LIELILFPGCNFFKYNNCPERSKISSSPSFCNLSNIIFNSPFDGFG